MYVFVCAYVHDVYHTCRLHTPHTPPTPNTQICVGELVLSSALQRKESRGGHYCVEYPAELEEQRREVIIAQSLPTRTDLAKVVGTKAALPMAVASVRRPRRPRRTTPSGPPSPLPVERPSRELSVRVTRRDQG